MKKVTIALLATVVLSVPALAASNMNPPPQGAQTQQPRAQQSHAQPANDQQGQTNYNNLNTAQNQPNNEQTIAPDSLSQKEIRQVQQALDKNGVKVGRVDGRWGPKSSNALKQFQQSKNIPANGQLDQQTLSDLGLNSAQFAQQNENESSQNR